MKGRMKGFWILKGLKFAVLGAAFVSLASLAVMLLWNWLMPAIFGLGAISWLQSLGLLALAKILFGGHRGGGRGWGNHKGHGHWREKMEAKWEGMSEEQKAQMRERWGRGCGHQRNWAPKEDTQKEAG